MKIAVAMSGGVDSSVTAALLKKQGHHVIGITMRLFENCSNGIGSAAFDAAAVARHLTIEHHVVDFESQFKEIIIDDFISEYRSAHTPNPCVRCNRFIKFGLLLEAANKLGADLLATGHYVRKTTDSDGTCHLRPAYNLGKDQSYFLYTLTQATLSQILFPLGEIESKDEVRRLAREFGLPVAEKGDSQEVCFIPGDDYVSFLHTVGGVADKSGEIAHISGKKVGEHFGTHRYTIGQRKGLGIAWSVPLYVIDLLADENRVVVGEEHFVFADGLYAEQINWINRPVDDGMKIDCKIRYRHQPVGCTLCFTGESKVEVLFEERQKSITPGQSIVFYNNNEVLGGGIITSAIRRKKHTLLA